MSIRRKTNITYNFNNINEFFENLMNKPNANLNMLCVYGAYEREAVSIKLTGREDATEWMWKLVGGENNP